MIAGKDSSLRTWIGASFVWVLVHGLLNFYLIFHLGLGIPLTKLAPSFAIISIATLIFGPAMYWANNPISSASWDTRKRRTLVIGVYFWITCMVVVFYAGQFGLMSADDVIPLSVITTAGVSVSTIAAYRIVPGSIETQRLNKDE